MAQEKDNNSLSVENVIGKTELYFEENKKNIITLLLVIAGVVGVYLGYKYLYLAGEEEAASAKMFQAEEYFRQGNYEMAINGEPAKDIFGFAQVVDEYGMTSSGNLAQYYLGMALLNTGKFAEAIEHLEAFESDDHILGPQATAAIGDAHMEMGNIDEAITYYLKAAEQDVNIFNTPLFLKKAALANEEKKSYPVAVQLYERIKNEFSQTEIARDMDKYISRAKVLGDLK